MEQQQQAAMVLTKEQINRQRALESQMQSLYEVEYRDEVLQYMYEMEVSSALPFLGTDASRSRLVWPCLHLFC